MADVLAEIGGFRFTIRSAGIAAALVTLALFMILRFAMNKKTAAGERTLFRWADALGFGMMPAAAVWKLFENRYTGRGREVIEPLPLVGELTEDGRFLPCNIEAALILLCFAGICIWLMIRKDGAAGKGDLLIISLCLLAGIRIVTESFREDPVHIIRYVYCAVILVCLAVWTGRQARDPRGKQRIAGSWIAAVLCTAMIVLTASGTLSVGSAIGDLAVITGCAVLDVLLALTAGSDARGWEASRPPEQESGEI